MISISVEPMKLSLNVLYRRFARQCTDAAWRLKLSFIVWLSPFFPRMSVLSLTRKAPALFKKHFKPSTSFRALKGAEGGRGGEERGKKGQKKN
jgi:hypothetical protein